MYAESASLNPKSVNKDPCVYKAPVDSVDSQWLMSVRPVGGAPKEAASLNLWAWIHLRVTVRRTGTK